MSAHTNRDLHEEIVLFVSPSRRIERQQRTENGRRLRHGGGLLLNKLDFGAFENRNVRELRSWKVATILDHQQSGSDDFENKAPCRNRTRHTPDMKIAVVCPNADMNPGSLDSRRQAGKQVRFEP